MLADDIASVARACGAERFHLVGESIGGTAALAYVLREPARVLSLTLSNAAARGGLIGNVASWKEVVAREGQEAWARQMMERRAHRGALPPEVAAWWLKLHETCDIQVSLALAEMLLAADFTGRLGEVRAPTLLLSPDASPFIPLEVMVAMRGMIPGAELQVFAHARHGLPLTHGDRCPRVLRDFLSRRCSA